MMNLLVCLTATPLAAVDANLTEDLSWFQCCRQEVNEEISGSDRALTAQADCDQFRFEREDGCRPIAGRIGVGQAATNCSLVAHLHITNAASAFGQQRTDLLKQGGRFNLIVSSGRPNPDLRSGFLN